MIVNIRTLYILLLSAIVVGCQENTTENPSSVERPNILLIITDDQGTILGLPPMPGVVNFDGAGPGVCLIWHLSYEDGLEGLEDGLNANDLLGCYDLSNPIEVIREDCGGGDPDCNNITITAGTGSIIVTGLADAPVTSLQIFNAQWQQEFYK